MFGDVLVQELVTALQVKLEIKMKEESIDLKIIIEIKELVKAGKIRPALKVLEKYLSKESDDYNELVQISARVNFIEDEKNKGLITDDVFFVEINKAIKQFLLYLDNLKQFSKNGNKDIEGAVFKEVESLKTKFELDFFKNHPALIKAKASGNTWEFLLFMMAELHGLKNKIDSFKKDRIRNNFENPEFVKLLEKAIEISSMTEESVKKNILAKIIRDRLVSNSNTFESILYKRSIEAIEYLTVSEFGILKYLTRIKFIDTHKNSDILSNMDFSKYQEYLCDYFSDCLFEIDIREVLQLKELNMIEINTSNKIFLGPKIFPAFRFASKEADDFFKATEVGQKLTFDWERNYLGNSELTQTGGYLSDLIIEG